MLFRVNIPPFSNFLSLHNSCEKWVAIKGQNTTSIYCTKNSNGTERDGDKGRLGVEDDFCWFLFQQLLFDWQIYYPKHLYRSSKH